MLTRVNIIYTFLQRRRGLTKVADTVDKFEVLEKLNNLTSKHKQETIKRFNQTESTNFDRVEEKTLDVIKVLEMRKGALDLKENEKIGNLNEVTFWESELVPRRLVTRTTDSVV